MALFGLGSSAPAAPAPVANAVSFDVDTQDFETRVIKASMEKPIIVDFWAPWCGPCKQLMPVLEAAVADAKGDVLLAKVNIDNNPELAQALRIQSVPTVMAFFQGQPVTAFSGARPASEIKNLIAQLVQLAKQGAPEALDIPASLKAAAQSLSDGDPATAQAIYAQILQQDDKNVEAYCGLVRTFIAAGQFDHAQKIITNAPDTIAKHPNFAAAKTALELAQANPGGDPGKLSAAVQANPLDHPARLELAHAQFAAGQKEQAIDSLLEIIARDRAWNDDAARKELLKFFDAMGPSDPVTAAGRKKLSRILFS
jgi:putative thioredoxin